MKKIGDIPEKNSSEWKRNEKLINETPALRNVRDITEGFRPSGGRIATGTSSQAYKDNWERIFGKKDKTDE